MQGAHPNNQNCNNQNCSCCTQTSLAPLPFGPVLAHSLHRLHPVCLKPQRTWITCSCSSSGSSTSSGCKQLTATSSCCTCCCGRCCCCAGPGAPPLLPLPMQRETPVRADPPWACSCSSRPAAACADPGSASCCSAAAVRSSSSGPDVSLPTCPLCRAVPSCPLLFQPQAYTAPSRLMHTVCAMPAAAAASGTPSRASHSWGVGTSTVLPLQHWPCAFQPQQ